MVAESVRTGEMNFCSAQSQKQSHRLQIIDDPAVEAETARNASVIRSRRHLASRRHYDGRRAARVNGRHDASTSPAQEGDFPYFFFPLNI
jgi:hypothetical protein